MAGCIGVGKQEEFAAISGFEVRARLSCRVNGSEIKEENGFCSSVSASSQKASDSVLIPT